MDRASPRAAPFPGSSMACVGLARRRPTAHAFTRLIPIRQWRSPRRSSRSASRSLTTPAVSARGCFASTPCLNDPASRTSWPITSRTLAFSAESASTRTNHGWPRTRPRPCAWLPTASSWLPSGSTTPTWFGRSSDSKPTLGQRLSSSTTRRPCDWTSGCRTLMAWTSTTACPSCVSWPRPCGPSTGARSPTDRSHREVCWCGQARLVSLLGWSW